MHGGMISWETIFQMRDQKSGSKRWPVPKFQLVSPADCSSRGRDVERLDRVGEVHPPDRGDERPEMRGGQPAEGAEQRRPVARVAGRPGEPELVQ